jgi:hypothetical protein
MSGVRVLRDPYPYNIQKNNLQKAISLLYGFIAVGTAKNEAKEPIKKVGFLLFNADFALNFAGFFSYAPRVRKTAFSDRTRDLA